MAEAINASVPVSGAVQAEADASATASGSARAISADNNVASANASGAAASDEGAGGVPDVADLTAFISAQFELAESAAATFSSAAAALPIADLIPANLTSLEDPIKSFLSVNEQPARIVLTVMIKQLLSKELAAQIRFLVEVAATAYPVDEVAMKSQAVRAEIFCKAMAVATLCKAMVVVTRWKVAAVARTYSAEAAVIRLMATVVQTIFQAGAAVMIFWVAEDPTR